MKRSDAIVTGVVYAVALFFFWACGELPPEAQTYPLGLIAALALLNTLYLGQCLMRALASGSLKLRNDLPEIFKGFEAKQFAFVAAGSIVFLILMYYAGYYLASAAYLIGTLLFFRLAPKWIAVTLVVLVALVWAVFSLFLKVPLPAGALFA